MKPGQWRFISAFFLGIAVLSTILPHTPDKIIVALYAFTILASIMSIGSEKEK